MNPQRAAGLVPAVQDMTDGGGKPRRSPSDPFWSLPLMHLAFSSNAYLRYSFPEAAHRIAALG